MRIAAAFGLVLFLVAPGCVFGDGLDDPPPIEDDDECFGLDGNGSGVSDLVEIAPNEPVKQVTMGAPENITCPSGVEIIYLWNETCDPITVTANVEASDAGFFVLDAAIAYYDEAGELQRGVPSPSASFDIPANTSATVLLEFNCADFSDASIFYTIAADFHGGAERAETTGTIALDFTEPTP